MIKKISAAEIKTLLEKLKTNKALWQEKISDYS